MANKEAKFYDVPEYSYVDYWKERGYEHQAEEIAIRRLLKGKHFKHGLDVGGGYGRLTKLISEYCVQAELVEPSDQQRAEGSKFLAGSKNAGIVEGTITEIPFPDASADLVLVVRVLHHILEITPAIQEISRVLQPGGYLLLEVANSTHFKAQLRSLSTGKPIPRTPVSVATDPSTTFVNHHPESVKEALAASGLHIEKTLSVSNFRLPGLKKIVPTPLLLALEKPLQKSLGSMAFGPSLVVLARKA
jgi:ubiquinone/menaquinone biosynthesis C-methylase UbiE